MGWVRRLNFGYKKKKQGDYNEENKEKATEGKKGRLKVWKSTCV